MHRRRFVAVAGTLGVTAAAGCLGSDGGTDMPDQAPMISDTTFTVRRIESGTEVDEAAVAFAAPTVTVDGTIWGADGCTTAELAGADYDAPSGELAVAVATRREANSGDVACTEAIVEIDYEAAVTFENGLPARVVVMHTRGEASVEVTTVER